MIISWLLRLLDDKVIFIFCFSNLLDYIFINNDVNKTGREELQTLDSIADKTISNTQLDPIHDKLLILSFQGFPRACMGISHHSLSQ